MCNASFVTWRAAERNDIKRRERARVVRRSDGSHTRPHQHAAPGVSAVLYTFDSGFRSDGSRYHSWGGISFSKIIKLSTRFGVRAPGANEGNKEDQSSKAQERGAPLPPLHVGVSNAAFPCHASRTLTFVAPLPPTSASVVLPRPPGSSRFPQSRRCQPFHQLVDHRYARDRRHCRPPKRHAQHRAPLCRIFRLRRLPVQE